MKKFTLLLVALPLFTFAQSIQKSPALKLSPVKNALSNKAVPYVRTIANDALSPSQINAPSSPHQFHYGGLRDVNAVEIGETTYDLQTNNAIYPRIFNNGDGTYSAVWTMSKNGTWSDRGTGYNYFDGASWGPAPASRLESERCGFTNICMPSNGNEIVFSHQAINSATPSQLDMVHRNPKGSGSWTENNNLLHSPSAGSEWARMIRGGTDGNTLHVIALTENVANGGTKYKGQDGALLYSRSTDGGNTWDKSQVDLPGIDSSQYSGFGGDSYAIDANGNTVAIVIGGFTNDWILLKSTDNGDTWTKTIIWQFAIPFYAAGQVSDATGDGIADTLDTNDGSVAVLVDENGVVHTWAGYNRLFNDGTATTGYYYFPGTNGLMYWNDAVGGTPAIITGALDLDGNGQLDITQLGKSYGCGLSSFPSAGEDDLGNIYLSYWAIVENTADPSGNALGHSYLIYTRDEGTTWSSFDGQVGPFDYTNQDNFTEACYGSIERTVNNEIIHCLVQEDACAGQGVSTDANNQVLDPCNTGQTNSIVAITIQNFIAGVPSVSHPAVKIKVYPVPSQGIFTIEGITDPKVSLNITNALGQIVMRFDNEAVYNNSVQLDLSSLESGLYNVNFESDGKTISKNIALVKQD